jgi:hypothetical protein
LRCTASRLGPGVPGARREEGVRFLGVRLGAPPEQGRAVSLRCEVVFLDAAGPAVPPREWPVRESSSGRPRRAPQALGGEIVRTPRGGGPVGRRRRQERCWSPRVRRGPRRLKRVSMPTLAHRRHFLHWRRGREEREEGLCAASGSPKPFGRGWKGIAELFQHIRTAAVLERSEFVLCHGRPPPARQ